MKRLYPEHDTAPLYRPPYEMWRAIHANIVGGRVDTLAQPSRRFPVLWEHDMNSAYPAAATRVPAGTATAFTGAAPSFAVAWIQHCVVTIPVTVPLGPLPYREGADEVSYPDTAGSVFEGWYTHEEQAAAERIGYQLERKEGVCWPMWSDALAAWAHHMYALRDAAPSDIVRGLVKLASVAAIGRFGSDIISGEIVAEQPEGDDWDYYTNPDPMSEGITDWYISRKVADREGLLVHISAYVHANVRLATWAKAWTLAQEGRLAATNYDAVYEIPTSQTASITSADMGAWKSHLLHHARIRAPRWIESTEKTRTPGVSRGA